MRSLFSFLLIAIVLTPAPGASAQQPDVAVAGDARELLLLHSSGETPTDERLRYVATRRLYFGNRDGDAGSSPGSTVTREPETGVNEDEVRVTPQGAGWTGALVGRDRPTAWSKAIRGLPKSASAAKVADAQLVALGPGAALQTAYTWLTDAGLMIVEVTAVLPDDAPDEFDGKRSAAIYLFTKAGSDWLLSGALSSTDGDTSDVVRTVTVLAVGRDRTTGEVSVFVDRSWYEVSTAEQFLAGSFGLEPAAIACSACAD